MKDSHYFEHSQHLWNEIFSIRDRLWHMARQSQRGAVRDSQEALQLLKRLDELVHELSVLEMDQHPSPPLQSR